VSFTTQITEGTALITLSDMKTYLKISTTADDALITAMIEAATIHAEAFCGRDLRDNVYEFLTTDFGEISVIDFPYRISPFNFAPISDTTFHIRRATVETIDSIEYSVGDSFSTIATSVYYASRRLVKTFLLLKDGQAWPTDADEIEDNVKVTYTTRIPDNVELAIAGIQRHVALMYEDRGDCEPANAGALGNRTASQSGAEAMYQSLQVPAL
jgi:hypothetical protein